MTPTLRSVIAHLERELAEVSSQDIPAAMGELERLKAMALARLVAAAATPTLQDGDRLLRVEEAADKLGMEVDYLYRHAKKFPFTVRPAPGQLRFSREGIEKHIRQHTG